MFRRLFSSQLRRNQVKQELGNHLFISSFKVLGKINRERGASLVGGGEARIAAQHAKVSKGNGWDL